MAISQASGNAGLNPGIYTSSTRPASPADGLVISETDTDSLSVYKGTAWAPVSGLTLIKTQTVGTTVSSVTVSDAFSATYDNYKVTYTGGVASTGIDLQMTLGATAAGYYFALGYIPWAGGVSNITVNNGSSWAYIGGASTKFAFTNCDIYRPFAADETVVAVLGANDANSQFAGGYLNNSTSYTAFTITTSSGTLTGGTIRVYGYANS
jgi:hypothetical protein